MLYKLNSLLFSFLIITTSFFAQKNDIPQKPSPQRLVNNLSKEFPNFLSPNETAQLEQKLINFSDSTSNQIVIVIVDELNGYEPWEFATRLGEQWGVGQAKEDNGIVILIKPTGGKNDRKFHIAIGKGLEGAIPDGTAYKVQESELLPYLKTGEYYKALDQTTTVLMSLAKGEYNSKEYAKKKKSNKGLIKAVIILIIIFVFFILKSRNGGGNGGNDGLTMGAAGFLFGSGFGRSSGGGFGGGSSGGGFGGFGGGGFGGGGSGGSW